ncbi:helix-turn-helix domain-containing protein [Enterococcus durans]|uniref:helix-turn-helix domain-containing protein n=1 Tax=Enterococcus durans TaxID=53345 RepID=UPI00356AF53E
MTNSDKRSVLNHCEHIQELSKGHFNKETRNYSYSGTSIDYQKLILAILDHSSVFQLVHTLCLQSQVDLTEFSKSRNISESFLRRHLTCINQLLEKYRIQIKTAKGHIFIRGEETQIRYLIYLILWQSYRGVEWPFKGVDFHQVFLVIEKSFQLINQRPNKIKMMEWCFIVAITKLRADQENRIQKERLPSFTDQLWLAFEEIASELSIGFNRLSLTTSEIEFLFLWLQTRTSFYLNDHFLDKATKIHLKEDTPIKQFQNNFYRYLYSIGFKSSQINSKKRLLNSTLFGLYTF